jgi:6-aminohexanoate-oligomer endohydrolase
MKPHPFVGLVLVATALGVPLVGSVQTPATAQTEPRKDDPATAPGKKLIPKTPSEGPAVEFDFPSLRIGVAEYEEGPTGTTVFYFPKRVFAVVDARGGAPGTLMTDAIRFGYDDTDAPRVDAICFAGGSCYGLEAATGVMAELLLLRGSSNQRQDIAFVPGAIVFDFNHRANAIAPDKELGRAAFKAAKPGRFLLGPRGAGRFVHVGGYFGPEYRERSGQGGAFRQVGPTKIAVFTVVNSVGAIVDRQGTVVRGNRDPKSGNRTPIEDAVKAGARAKPGPKAGAEAPQAPSGNTTITLVVTNQKLSYTHLQRLAIQTHTSLHRAIQPLHTADDGDTLFAVTTAEVKNEDLSLRDLSTHAADLAWEAVLSAMPK